MTRQLFAAIFFLLPTAVLAQSTTLVNNGPPVTRIDVVFVPSGFSAAEMPTFAAACDRAVNQFRILSPFKEYFSYFNFHRVTYNAIEAPDVDERITILNGSGRSYATIGGEAWVYLHYTGLNNDEVPRVVVHEAGHSFNSILEDEYDYGNPPSGANVNSPNLSNQTGDNLKWIEWIDAGTPIPTSFLYGFPAGSAQIGMFERNSVMQSYIYRPAKTCQMSSAGNVPFDAVCRQQTIRGIYQYPEISGIDSYSFAGYYYVYAGPSTTEFFVTLKAPSDHALTAAWYVDRVVRQSSGTTFSLPTPGLAPGLHEVQVVVRDLTPNVRRDPLRTTTDILRWQLVVPGGTTRPALTQRAAETVALGEPVRFDASSSYDPDGTIQTIRWDFGDGGTATGAVVEHAFRDLGTFTVLLLGLDNSGTQSVVAWTKTVVTTAPASTTYAWSGPNDGFQENATGVVNLTSAPLPVGNSRTAALRFTGVLLPPGAIVVDGRFHNPIPSNLSYVLPIENRIVNLQIRGEAAPNSAPLQTALFDFSNRARTPVTIPWNTEAYKQTDGNFYLFYWSGFSITPLLQSITAVPGWSKGNALTLFLEDPVGTSDACIGAYENGAPARISYNYRMGNTAPGVAIATTAGVRGDGPLTVSFLARAIDPDGTLASYLWNFGDGEIASGNRPVHTYAFPGNYTVSVTATDDDGNATTSTHLITVGVYRGDMNGDLFVTSADIILLQNFIFLGGPKPQFLEQADLNADRVPTASDLVLLMNYVYLGTPIPPPVYSPATPLSPLKQIAVD